jgi:hypothetical protein
MPHHADRPTKVCAVCGRPFQWRKKWKDVWDDVRYCSDRCRNNRNPKALRNFEKRAGGIEVVLSLV